MQERRHGFDCRPARRPAPMPPRGCTCPPKVARPSPWVALTAVPSSPLQAHAATPAELRERIEAERARAPVPRPARRRRRPAASSTSRPARAAERRPRRRQRREPALGHGGLAAARRARAHRGASGRSATTACRATAPTSTATRICGPHAPARRRRRPRRADRRSPTAAREAEDSTPDRRSPVPRLSLARPARRPSARSWSRSRARTSTTSSPRRRPTQTSPASCTCSVDAVKAHLRSLFQRFGIEHLPQNQKRSRLVAEALQSGVVATRDL